MNEASLPLQACGRTFDLLKPDSVSQLLASVVSSEWFGSDTGADLRVERCWPVGTPDASGFVLEWSFRVRGRRYAIYGEYGSRKKARATSARGANRRREPVITADGIRGLSLAVDGAELMLRSPDSDEVLPQMATCLDRRLMAGRLAAFGLRSSPNGVSGSAVRCRLGGYRPGRRAAIRYGIQRGAMDDVDLCGKTFRDDRGRDLIRLHLRLSEELRRRCGGRVRVPSPVGFDEELRAALFVWAAGKRGETVESAHEGVIRAAVEGLTTLHDLRLQDGSEFGARDEFRVVDRWRRVIHRLLPSAAEEADGVAEMIGAAVPRVQPREFVTIHRDFYDKQLVISPQCVTILDLDTLARGNACVDLGNFLAHLMLRSMASNATAAEHASFAHQFLAAYEDRRGAVEPDHLAFYLASSLFRLGAVHSLRSTTSRYRHALWASARQVLQRRTFDSKDMVGLSAFRSNGRIENETGSEVNCGT